MPNFLARLIGPLCLALTIIGTANLRAQVLRTLTANTQGQTTATLLSPCGNEMLLPSSIPGFPQALPPSTSGPVVYVMSLCFEPQGYQSRFPPEHYVRDIHLPRSAPSRGLWIPYDATVEKVILEDYQRLWTNNDLVNLSIDIRDFVLSNGVVGKLVSYNITERN
jgi:hypothetical protein